MKRAGLVKQLFTSATELAETETARQKWLMFQSRLGAWRATLGALRALVRDWERQLDRVEEDLHQARDAAMRHTAEAAERVHPLRRQGDDDTNTYYDLETGAVNEEMLGTYIRVIRARCWTNRSPMPMAWSTVPRGPWRVVRFCVRLPHSGKYACGRIRECRRAQIGARTAICSRNPDLAILRQELADAFDLRNVVQAEQDGDHRPANYRLSQALQTHGAASLRGRRYLSVHRGQRGARPGCCDTVCAGGGGERRIPPGDAGL